MTRPTRAGCVTATNSDRNPQKCAMRSRSPTKKAGRHWWICSRQKTDNDVRLGIAQAMSDTASARADLEAARVVWQPEEMTRAR